jgi:hypothetical protein
VKRLTMIGIAVVALSAVGAAAAGEGSWSPWEPTFQGAITVPAGFVCPFGISAEPVREDLRIRYHYDEAGNIDGDQVVGPLIAHITNTATGASVDRNLSGLGTVFYQPDGSWDAVLDGNLLVFLRAGDSPPNQLLLIHGRSVLHGSPTGQKTLVSSTGGTENLCETLA